MDIGLFIFLLYFYCGLAEIRIKELKVPDSIEIGSVEDVILDCDFDADGENGIEVKWFFNGHVHQIYQWIPETNKPGQALGMLKDNVDVNYKITNDRNTMHRALHIVDISPEMSGNYTCKISGDFSEAYRTKPMIIYEPADSGLNLVVIEEEPVIICSAQGIYPRPNMTIYIANDNGSEVLLFQDEENTEIDDITGLYNVTSLLYFNAENLSNPFDYVCELNIPGTTYNLRELKTHYFALEIETQIEEDYVNFLNNINSTMNSSGDAQDSGAIQHLSILNLTSVLLLIIVCSILNS